MKTPVEPTMVTAEGKLRPDRPDAQIETLTEALGKASRHAESLRRQLAAQAKRYQATVLGLQMRVQILEQRAGLEALDSVPEPQLALLAETLGTLEMIRELITKGRRNLSAALNQEHVRADQTGR